MDDERESSTKSGVIGSIDLRQSDSVVDLSGTVHQLPCCIKFDGPSPVSHYFKPKQSGIEVDGISVEEAYFRGRKLQGATVQLLHGYSGFVLGKKKPNKKILGKKSPKKKKTSELSDDDLNSWEANAKFDRITFWNHDSLPSPDDPCLRIFHWFPVAEALHRPVTAEDMFSVPK